MPLAPTDRSLPRGLALTSNAADAQTGRWIAALVLAFLAGVILPDIRLDLPDPAATPLAQEDWHGNVRRSAPDLY